MDSRILCYPIEEGKIHIWSKIRWWPKTKEIDRDPVAWVRTRMSGAESTCLILCQKRRQRRKGRSKLRLTRSLTVSLGEGKHNALHGSEMAIQVISINQSSQTTWSDQRSKEVRSQMMSRLNQKRSNTADHLFVSSSLIASVSHKLREWSPDRVLNLPLAVSSRHIRGRLYLRAN